MSEITFIEARPRHPVTRAVTVVRLAGGGAFTPYRYLGQNYQAGLIERPRFAGSLSFDDSGWSGGTVPGVTTLAFMPAQAGVIDALAAHYWRGANIWIDGGEETGPITRKLTGTVADAAVRDGVLLIAVADLSRSADKNILSPAFLGTGGIEGPEEATGRPKRRSWGVVANVEGRLIDPVNNIYEFGDPSKALQAFTALRDKGRTGAFTTLAYQGSVAATFTALQNAAAAQGGGVAAASIACAKWWTQPAGPLTADVQGETAGGYTNSIAGIAARILAASAAANPGQPAININNFAAADALRPGIAGMHAADESETAARLLDRFLLGVSCLWVLAPAGTVSILPWTFGGGTETLNAQFIARERSLPPVKSVSVGYRRNHRQHGDGEISAALLLEDGSDVAAAIAATNARLAEIASDNLLTPVEKPFAIRDRDAILTEQAGIVAQATAFAIVADKTAYQNAITALTTYLATLTAPVLWSNLTGNTTIVGATFQQKFKDVFAAKEVLRTKIADVAKARADLGVTNAAAANSAATAANASITNISSDSLLTPGEKPLAIRDRDAILTEQTGIVAQATDFGITAEKTAYQNAITALTTYLATLTAPVLWSNLTGNTAIVGVTFQQKFKDVFAAKEVLRTKIADVAALAVGQAHVPVAIAHIFSAAYNGVLNTQQLPAAFMIKRYRGAVDVSASSVWSIVSQGSISGATVTVANGGVTIPASATMPLSAVIRVKSERDGFALYTDIAISRVDAVAPNTGSTPSGGTSVNDASLINISSTAFVAVSDILTVKTGGAGQIAFSGALDTYVDAAAPAGSFGVSAQWTYRLKSTGGTFGNAGATIVGGLAAVTETEGQEFYTSSPGFINVARQLTGLVANSDYEVRLTMARTTATPTKIVSFGGSVFAQGS